MFQLSDFKEWIMKHYPHKKEDVDGWSEHIRPCEPNEGTGTDIHLIQSIKDSITDRFIETGTEAGSFTLNFVDTAKEIITCELDEINYLCAKYRHEDIPNIQGYKADSRTFLDSFNLRDSDVFFLDAHGGGYDLFNDNPLTHELQAIKRAGITPTIFIHDFGIETDKTPNDGNYWHHEALDKVYEYRFDFDPVPNGWKLDWNFIKDDIEEIYGKNYKIEYPPFQNDDVVVGWIKISHEVQDTQ